jgi:hypothetical protein
MANTKYLFAKLLQSCFRFVETTAILYTEPQCLYSFPTGSVHLFFSASAPGQSAPLAQLSTQGYGVQNACKSNRVYWAIITNAPVFFDHGSHVLVSHTKKVANVPSDLGPTPYAQCACLNRTSLDKLAVASKHSSLRLRSCSVRLHNNHLLCMCCLFPFLTHANLCHIAKY